MAHSISTQDLKKLLEFSVRLQDCRTKVETAQVAIDGLMGLIDAHFGAWNEFDHDTKLISGEFSRPALEMPHLPEIALAFEEFYATHPAVETDLIQFQDPQPFRTSDLTTQRDFEKRPIFDEVYKRLDIRYHMGHDCRSLHFLGMGTAVGRWDRKFDDREFEIYKIACQHISHAYWRVERWSNDFQGKDHVMWNIRLSRELIITEISPLAALFLQRFYDARETHFLLPAPILKLIEDRQRQHGLSPWQDRIPTPMGKRKQPVEVLTARNVDFEYMLQLRIPSHLNLELDGNPDFERLSDQEKLVVRLTLANFSEGQIMNRLQIKRGTVTHHQKKIRDKLQVGTYDEALRKLINA